MKNESFFFSGKGCANANGLQQQALLAGQTCKN